MAHDEKNILETPQKQLDKESRIDTFWYRLDRVLMLRKMTLKELSKETGIKYQTIAGWRMHKRLPDLSSALDIASALDVSVEYLTEIGYLQQNLKQKVNEFMIDINPAFAKNNMDVINSAIEYSDKLNSLLDLIRVYGVGDKADEIKLAFPEKE